MHYCRSQQSRRVSAFDRGCGSCGEGTLDIKLYAQLATAENSHMPMIIEHLTTDEEYVASVQYVRERLADL